MGAPVTFPVVYKLQRPIEFGQQQIAELKFREMEAGDLRGAPESHNDLTLHLIGKLAGQPSQVVDKLKMVDLGEVAKLVEGFIDPSPATGKTT